MRQWLDAAWAEVLEAGQKDPDDEVDRLVNSRLVSIRHAFVTQLLGKIADPTRSLMAFQLGEQEAGAGAWDARSFCTAVVVPWVAENHNVMGTSPDPYVINPLRRPGSNAMRRTSDTEKSGMPCTTSLTAGRCAAGSDRGGFQALPCELCSPARRSSVQISDSGSREPARLERNARCVSERAQRRASSIGGGNRHNAGSRRRVLDIRSYRGAGTE